MNLRMLALAAALALIGASPVLDSYVPPAGWRLDDTMSTISGFSDHSFRIWRRGNESIGRDVQLRPFKAHTADDIRRMFSTQANSFAVRIVVDSLTSLPPCGEARERWAVYYRETGLEAHTVLAVLQYTTDYQVILHYARPSSKTRDAAAVESLLAYCAPSDTPADAGPTAIPAQPQPHAERAATSGAVELFGFSYVPPPRWRRSSTDVSVKQPTLGALRMISWSRGNDIVTFGAVHQSSAPVPAVDAQALQTRLSGLYQDVSAVQSTGCDGRSIIIAEFKSFHRTPDDPFDEHVEYTTQVWMAGKTNYALLEYRRSTPPTDESFMRSVNNLCFVDRSAGAEIGVLL